MKPPISDPFSAPDLSCGEDGRIFRISFWRYFFLSLLAGLALVLPILLVANLDLPMGAQVGIAFGGIMGGSVAGLLATMAMFWLTPVKVGRRGLKSSSFWGVVREVEWSQIQAAKFLWLGLPYILISTPTKRNFIWLPLLLRDMKGFARAVEELAPAENPLRLWVQKRGF